MARKKVRSISKLKKELWVWFSRYIRLRDKGICFSCGKHAQDSGYHAGHFISRSIGGLSLYFHEKNVNGQCYNCNINLGGNQYIYGERLKLKYGPEICNELYQLKGQTTKWSEQDYLEKIEHYKKEVNHLVLNVVK